MRYWMIIALLIASGCGSMEARESDRLARGYTPCNDLPDPEGGVICHPNQYCASQKYNWCHTGCLSDDNCSHEQVCVKGVGFNVGECMDVATLPDPNPQLDPGYTQCGNPQVPEQYEVCQPSQYCYSYRYGDCAPGCLSEDNCTESQVCEKEVGENVGTCQTL